jgi:DNA repair protein RecO (recombination protein O)
MAPGTCAAVVVGRLPLGESDRLVTFFSREHGKLRGVARAARRVRSRFGGGLELFTLGTLVFFDSGRSELARIDHFDIAHPFVGVREDLERLGQAAWMAECVSRLTAERDPQPALFRLLVRGLRSLETSAPPASVAVAFGLRCVEALGHRLRFDACVGCGRAAGLPRGPVAVDVEAGGLLCRTCATPAHELRLSPAALVAARRLRAVAWAEAVTGGGAGVSTEIRRVLDRQIEGLIGHPIRTSRFLRSLAPVTAPGAG